MITKLAVNSARHFRPKQSKQNWTGPQSWFKSQHRPLQTHNASVKMKTSPCAQLLLRASRFASMHPSYRLAVRSFTSSLPQDRIKMQAAVTKTLERIGSGFKALVADRFVFV
jgi:hypothetical protein